VNLTVGPGKYFVRLKFAATRGIDTAKNCFNICLNGHEVAHNLDVAATAGGPNKAVDLVFNHIAPENGVIDIRFTSPRIARVTRLCVAKHSSRPLKQDRAPVDGARRRFRQTPPAVPGPGICC